uniref:Uncharacterized protein n=1 Tax=Chrysotila carterae TaxID=13221 RepID=A0A6S9RRY4_CHRCT
MTAAVHRAASSSLTVRCIFLCACPTLGLEVFINEVAFDGQRNRALAQRIDVELAGPAGPALAGHTLRLLDAATGFMYHNRSLDALVLPDQHEGYGAAALRLPLRGALAIALVDRSATVRQLLSCTSAASFAFNVVGHNAIADNVCDQLVDTHRAASIALVGSGSRLANFSWHVQVKASLGWINPGQRLQDEQLNARSTFAGQSSARRLKRKKRGPCWEERDEKKDYQRCLRRHGIEPPSLPPGHPPIPPATPLLPPPQTPAPQEPPALNAVAGQADSTADSTADSSGSTAHALQSISEQSPTQQQLLLQNTVRQSGSAQSIDQPNSTQQVPGVPQPAPASDQSAPASNQTIDSAKQGTSSTHRSPRPAASAASAAPAEKPQAMKSTSGVVGSRVSQRDNPVGATQQRTNAGAVQLSEPRVDVDQDVVVDILGRLNDPEHLRDDMAPQLPTWSATPEEDEQLRDRPDATGESKQRYIGGARNLAELLLQTTPLMLGFLFTFLFLVVLLLCLCRLLASLWKSTNGSPQQLTDDPHLERSERTTTESGTRAPPDETEMQNQTARG